MRRAVVTMLSLRAARAFLRPAVRAPLRRSVQVWSATESPQQQKPKKKKQQQQKKQQKVQKGAATQRPILFVARPRTLASGIAM